MTPILLDKADFLKLSVGSLLTVTTIFVAGFLYGYIKAEQQQQMTRTSVAMQLPTPVTATEEVREQMVPDTLPEGHDRDVDTAGVPADQGHPDTLPTIAQSGVTTADENVTVDIAPDPVPAVAETSAASPDGLGMGGPQPEGPVDPLEFMLDTADASSARFTIQVGLFGSVDNAERKLDALQSKNLNAYSNEYTDSKDRKRYNVRFGYFDTRKDALAALDSYREVFSADGYLVNMAR